MNSEVGAHRKILAQLPVRIIVRTSLPGRLWITEVDRQGDLLVASQLRCLKPGWELASGPGKV